MSKTEIIKIDEVKYIRKDAVKIEAQKLDNMPYVIIRSYDAGCFAGYLKSESEDGRKVELINARRLWYWSGSASLSQLAMEGVKYPGNCRFPREVNHITIMNVCEIISTTEQARQSIKDVPIWRS